MPLFRAALLCLCSMLSFAAPHLALMGGGGTVEEAFRYLIEKSNRGAMVVLRASGTEEFNAQLKTWGASSVRTFLFKDRALAEDPTVVSAVRDAASIYIAGGDQWNYVRYWKGTALSAAVDRMAARGGAIGGSSAGLAVMGQFVFSAENDTVRSPDALRNPYHRSVAIAHEFFAFPQMKGIITDSHFVERDRMGRLLVFLARIMQDGLHPAPRAIAIDRETAVLVDPDGKATVAGKNAAFFISTTRKPEVCKPDTPLTLRGIAVRRMEAGGVFDMNRWSGDSGVEYRLSVDAGAVSSTKADGKIY